MQEILTLLVGQLQTNCYIIGDPRTSDALVIDPGDAADYIERIIVDKHFKPQKIIATHGHFDHILSVTELQLTYKIPFLISQKDIFLVKNMRSSAKHFLGIEVDPIPIIDGYLKDGDEIVVGNCTMRVIETPGHTPGSICLYLKSDQLLFTGDLVFADGGVGRTDFSYSDPTALDNSLKRIFKLPGKTTIYPGHGSISTLAAEIKYHKEL